VKDTGTFNKWDAFHFATAALRLGRSGGEQFFEEVTVYS
jgi:hypothetical protein